MDLLVHFEGYHPNDSFCNWYVDTIICAYKKKKEIATTSKFMTEQIFFFSNIHMTNKKKSTTVRKLLSTVNNLESISVWFQILKMWLQKRKLKIWENYTLPKQMSLCEMESSCTPACFCGVFTEQLLNSWREKERQREWMWSPGLCSVLI